jgi:hypothetical protein
MLNVPNLPTDSLCKFVALSGLTLVVLSTVLPRLWMGAIWDKFDQLRIDMAVADAEGRNLDTDLRRVSLSAHAQELLWQRQRERVVHVATNSGRAATLQRLTNDLSSTELYEVVGGLGGILLLVTGFALWYSRVQVHQDQVLRSQAQAKEPPR